MENINIVIDFGLPVKIDLTNDLNGLTITSAAGAAYGATTLAEDGLSVTYTPTTILLGKDIIELILSDGSNSAINIIPATSIYYEDSFVTFESFDWGGSKLTGDSELWSQVGTVTDTTQSEDRPGTFSLSITDANNIYGFDAAYKSMTQYSMGSARKVTVTEKQNYATATFTFTGTGFDIISMTSNTTGVILADIYKGEGNSKTLHKSYLVDTYYGCTYDEATKTWTYNNTVENALYQVPVIKAAGLPFDTYTVEIVASYDDAFSNGQGGQDLEADNNSYDFYLDAIRIYDPADDGKEDKDVLDAYLKDDEGWPEYHTLRNKEYKFLSLSNYSNVYANTLSRRIINSIQEVPYEILILDNKNTTNSIDIATTLPICMATANSLQLIAGQSIIFKTNTADKLALSYQANNYGNSINFKLNGELKTLSTATPMYYLLQENGEQTKQVFTLSMPEDSSGILTIYDLRASSDNQEHSTVFEQLTRDELTTALAQIGYPLWDTYEYLIQRDTLEAIADALRNKNNITTNINPTNIAELIDNMSAIIGIENETLSLTNVVITDETITI